MDLNRNYDYKFGLDEEGSQSNPCDQIYRGKFAFSEPETRAIQRLIIQKDIQAAMNFHSYGDLWITPFNYYNGPIQEVMSPEHYNFYSEFFEYLKSNGFTSYGNGQQTIGYVANGEASDWMLGVHDIISFSPELGKTESFYPGKEDILEDIERDYKVIDYFLGRIYKQVTKKDVNLSLEMNKLRFQVQNQSLLDMKCVFTLKSDEEDFKGILQIMEERGDKIHEVVFEINEDFTKI